MAVYIEFRGSTTPSVLFRQAIAGELLEPSSDWGFRLRELCDSNPAEASRRLPEASDPSSGRTRHLMAGVGREQTTFREGNLRVAFECDAKCDALSADRIELLARAVILVAGTAIPEQDRAAVFMRVIAGLEKR